MQEEFWRPVVGYEGLYEVSNLGKVRSLNYHKQRGRIELMKPSLVWDGHLRVHLSKEGRARNKLVHRLVAEAFIPNQQMLPQINHKNEIKDDNRVENLEWCTLSYNMQYGTRVSRIAQSKRIPILQLSKRGEFVARYNSIVEAVERTGIPRHHIIDCARGRRKSTGGYKWKYDNEGMAYGQRPLKKPTKNREYERENN